MPKIFIDTNIFVYTHDNQDERKKEKARTILKRIVEGHQPVISTQVLKITNDLELIEQAIDISLVSQVSFWDALIIAAAEKSNCEFVFYEDLNPGQSYRGVRVLNPFVHEDF